MDAQPIATVRRGNELRLIAVALFVSALAPRLYYSLALHRLGEQLNTDMGSYAKGARLVLEHPLEPIPWFAFWPLGTSWLAAGVQALFGAENWDAVGVLYALLGAGSVVLAWDLARRASRYRVVSDIVGLLGIVYYPWIMQGGFLMSEPPFTFFLMAQAWFAVRWFQGGTRWDALGFGVAAALGTTVRPQMMTSVLVTLAVFAGSWPLVRARWRELGAAVAPVALMLVLTTAYLDYNSGQMGFVSHNGMFNFVFGRCHNYALSWRTPSGAGAFYPAGLLQVHRAELAAEKRDVSPTILLHPALTPELTLTSKPADSGPILELVGDCVRATGVVGQARYMVTNVLMLWHGNSQWPTDNEGWSHQAERTWRTIDEVVFEVPFLLSLGFLVGRNPAMRIVAANGAAMVLTAALYFGEVRMRLPYAMIIALLSLELCADGATRLGIPDAIRRRLDQRR